MEGEGRGLSFVGVKFPLGTRQDMRRRDERLFQMEAARVSTVGRQANVTASLTFFGVATGYTLSPFARPNTENASARSNSGGRTAPCPHSRRQKQAMMEDVISAESPEVASGQAMPELLMEFSPVEEALRKLESSVAMYEGFVFENRVLGRLHLVSFYVGLDYERRLSFEDFLAISESATRSGIPDEVRVDGMDSLLQADAVFLGRDDEGREVYVAVEVAVRGGPNELRKSRRTATYLSRATGARALPVIVSARLDDGIAGDVVDSETLGDGRRVEPEDSVLWVEMPQPR